jgi:hypothetical protein
VEKSLTAFAPYIPRHVSGSNLGALAIIMNFSTLVYNIGTIIFKRHKSDKLCHSNDKVKVSFYVIKHIK